MLEPAPLRGRDRYERVVEGWVDNTHPDAFTHVVRVADPDAAVEVEIVALPSPTYRIVTARGRALHGAVDPAAVADMATLGGTEMVGGLTRRAGEAAGSGAGAALVVHAVIEIARLSRQVAKLPREQAERAAGDPRACWDLDTSGWIDLPDSCFTYSAAGRALFDSRSVATPMGADLYSPRPGQRRVFERRKIARVERRGGRVTLFSSMHDNVHGFEITYAIDPATSKIVHAEHITPRLPYAGICTEPQRKIDSLLGETVDAGFRKRLSARLGGPTGCAQLFDLTADVFRLIG